MINLLKYGLIGGFLFFSSFIMVSFIFLIPINYTFDVIEKSNTWNSFYEKWLWSDLIIYEYDFFSDLKPWRLFAFVFIAGFVTYFIFAIKTRKCDFSE